MDGSEICKRLAALEHGSAEVAGAPHLLMVFAHPDDEVLAVGGRLPQLQRSRLITVTDGAPLDGADAKHHGFQSVPEYAAARERELQAVLQHAGFPAANAATLKVAGAILSDQTAAFHLAELTRALQQEIRDFVPAAVLTHPYEGGHPDHDSCAFAVWAAVQQSGSATPILESSFYFAREGTLQLGSFVSGDAGVATELDEAQRLLKDQLLAEFASQQQTLQLLRCDVERFRPAPVYDFTVRPSAEPLYYERFGWQMTGDRFCDLARSAMEQLQL